MYNIIRKKSKILTSVKMIPISLQKEKSSCKFMGLKKSEHAKWYLQSGKIKGQVQNSSHLS